MVKEERNSNFELMRIVSMIFIILWHIYYYGGIINNPRIMKPSIVFIFELMSFIIIVHVNSFALLTGYFHDKTKLKLRKVCTILDSMIFYRVVFIIFFTMFGLASLSKVGYIDFTFFNDYWFVEVYLALYLFTPFLNKLINHLSKKEHFRLLITGMLVLSFIPFFTSNKLVLSNNGYTLCNFVLLYFIGSYIKKYPVRNNFIFSHMSDNLYKIILLLIFILCVLFNFYSYKTIDLYSNLNTITDWINENNQAAALTYSNPIVIIQTLAYFLLFEQLSFKSKLVNKISKLTLGIYFIHENNFMRLHIYSWLRIYRGAVYRYRFVLYVFIMAFVIFILCGIIELIRQLLFKFIYSRKISKKINNGIGNFVSSIKIIDKTNYEKENNNE